MQYLLDSSSFFQSLHIERWSSLAVFTHDSSFLALLNAKFLTQRIVGKAEKFVSLTKQWLIALVQCWVDPEDLLNYNRAAIHHPRALQHTSVWLPAATHTHTHTNTHTHIQYLQDIKYWDFIHTDTHTNIVSLHLLWLKTFTSAPYI